MACAGWPLVIGVGGRGRGAGWARGICYRRAWAWVKGVDFGHPVLGRRAGVVAVGPACRDGDVRAGVDYNGLREGNVARMNVVKESWRAERE